MIVIRKAEYVASAVKYEQYPTGGLPEIAMAGRSNVGKSSLINRFLGRRNLARTGNTPGKTQTLNFYRVNDAWFLVDLPGYGYAKVAKSVNAQWGSMMGTYFKKREALRAVIQIVDIRHAPSREDVEMHQWLRLRQVPTMVVATKADKISRGQWLKHLTVIAKALEVDDASMILPFSAQTGAGVEELNESLSEMGLV
ncbi:ribosome biogenesis GTP-binding protein YihA/YsxC [Desulfosporosinus sp. FKB]|uniref:ribosome biogenesis GTP-binding protein YihA/YsxC n=1 Tax=Desulfosporosinus sp. FKB TaxID=1969835 RepID=UPI000B49E2FF|nr:ribosome biogenesis GTP-binding protein YihA/YsxC [Desulfosporosinus sp. FKB]